MKKPHEQEWDVGYAGSVIERDTLCAVRRIDAGVGEPVLVCKYASEAEAAFIAAAPDMARALLLVENEAAARLSGKTWDVLRAALRKAGVL